MKINQKIKSIGQIPKFPRELRDQIINYTDDKQHQSFQKVLDSPTLNKIFAGAKNASKSFSCMIDTIYRLVNEPSYCAVWARNLSTDIVNTINPLFQKCIDFLLVEHKLDFTPFFTVYQRVVVFEPTQQSIFFANFEIVNSFAGLTLKKSNLDICDVFFDEIQQNPAELGAHVQTIYAKQQTDMEFIKQATILRTPRKSGQQRRMIFMFNIYDSSHWICEQLMIPLLAFDKINRNELITKSYLFKEDFELDVSVLRMSRFYAPADTIDEFQRKEYDKLKEKDPKLYDITIAGEPYDLENATFIKPFIKYLFNDDNQPSEKIILTNDYNRNDYQMIVDGYDPGLNDKNGFCRIGLTNDFEIHVLFEKEITSPKNSSNARITTTEKTIMLIKDLNQIYEFDQSLLAIDSKDDAVIEIAKNTIAKNGLSISVLKAIKNKNPAFNIDFSITNRIKFLVECFQKEIIKFAPRAIKLISYLSKVNIDDNWKRNEKINPEIYDLVNAFEYALSMIYKIVIIKNESFKLR